jgi:hypothetical protein
MALTYHNRGAAAGPSSNAYPANKQGLCPAQNYCLALSLANLYVVTPDVWNALTPKWRLCPEWLDRQVAHEIKSLVYGPCRSWINQRKIPN